VNLFTWRRPGRLARTPQRRLPSVLFVHQLCCCFAGVLWRAVSSSGGGCWVQLISSGCIARETVRTEAPGCSRLVVPGREGLVCDQLPSPVPGKAAPAAGRASGGQPVPGTGRAGRSGGDRLAAVSAGSTSVIVLGGPCRRLRPGGFLAVLITNPEPNQVMKGTRVPAPVGSRRAWRPHPVHFRICEKSAFDHVGAAVVLVSKSLLLHTRRSLCGDRQKAGCRHRPSTPVFRFAGRTTFLRDRQRDVRSFSRLPRSPKRACYTSVRRVSRER
jgi:hypothetical protein